MFYTVYKTTNKVNGKIYFGVHQTKNPEDSYLGSGILLIRAIEKHGVENFEKEVLFTFDNPEDMFAKEAELVTEEFVQQDDNYNLKVGGSGGWDYVNNQSKEKYGENCFSEFSKKGLKVLEQKYGKDWNKILRLKGRDKLEQKYGKDWPKVLGRLGMEKVKSLYGEENLGAKAWAGKKHTRETRKKMSESRKGSKNPQYGTRWIHSLEEKRSTRIPKDDPLPKGWLEGRKIKF